MVQADSAKDALVIALRETGKVDFTRMNQLLHRPAEAIQKELQDEGLIFRNPTSAEWEIRDKYLTGNVREKLHTARAAMQEDPQYRFNVDALTAAMPPEIEAVDIGIRFGSTWVPGEVLSDFIEERIHGGRGHQSINYVPILGRWEAKVSVYDHAANTEVGAFPNIRLPRSLNPCSPTAPSRWRRKAASTTIKTAPLWWWIRNSPPPPCRKPTRCAKLFWIGCGRTMSAA